MPNHKRQENLCLEKTRWIVQYIRISQINLTELIYMILYYIHIP
jgi:hypothetical protein